jgi:hypothetical protein
MRLDEVLADVSSYFNPFDTSFDQYSFDALPLDKKVATVFCTVIGLVGIVIGALAAYRLCLKQFTVLSPTTAAASASRAGSAAARGQRAAGVALRMPPKPSANISMKTRLCKEKLVACLRKTREKLGTAVDNGDCYYDALRQGLSLALGRAVTVKELRMIVKTEVTRLDAADSTGNWVYKVLKKRDDPDDYDYYELLQSVDKTHAELDPPLWGRPEVDGKIIAEHFKVKIRFCEANALDDVIPKKQLGMTPDGTPYDKSTGTHYDNASSINKGVEARLIKALEPQWTETNPTTGRALHTVKIAGYPGHFMPVVPA